MAEFYFLPKRRRFRHLVNIRLSAIPAIAHQPRPLVALDACPNVFVDIAADVVGYPVLIRFDGQQLAASEPIGRRSLAPKSPLQPQRCVCASIVLRFQRRKIEARLYIRRQDDDKVEIMRPLS